MTQKNNLEAAEEKKETYEIQGDINHGWPVDIDSGKVVDMSEYAKPYFP